MIPSVRCSQQYSVHCENNVGGGSMFLYLPFPNVVSAKPGPASMYSFIPTFWA